MGSDQKRAVKRKVLKLNGDLTIARAHELLLALKQAIASANTVEIQLLKVNKVDLSALQLLCSAHHSALLAKKQLILNESIPEIFRNVAEKAGFTRHMGCNLNPNKGCLWVGACS